MMVELPINMIKKKEQENIAIILSSPCETSSNGIHLKTSEGTDWSHDSSNLRLLIAKKKNCILERLRNDTPVALWTI